MDYQFLTEKHFKDFSSSYIPAIVGIATFALIIFLIQITDTYFLAPFVLLIPVITGRLTLYYEFKKWRNEMVATGHITYEQFDSLADQYSVSARHYFPRKERIPFLIFFLVVIAISTYFFRLDWELKMFGKETIGTVYKISHRFALIEYYVGGKRYTTNETVQIGDNFSFKERVFVGSEHVVAKVGHTFRILYSSKDPDNSRVLDNLPINK
jgi:hypothetical protein